MKKYFLGENYALIDALYEQKQIEQSDWFALLTMLTPDEKEYLRKKATDVAKSNFGNGVYIRALTEISSYCKNNCFYCGLRASNSLAERYRLTKEEILDCCIEGDAMGFNTFVLQGGEDPKQNDEWITDVVCSIRERFPEKAITLSVGERSKEAYMAFRNAGANRYLLRHETRCDEHYSRLHPTTMSGEKRRKCLETLKELGFQTGSGMMVGSPFQTMEHLVEDIMFLEQLNPEMIGVGPFIPAQGTPFAKYVAGSVETTLLVVSLLRLRFPKALIPATTALSTLCENGLEKGILAGANVVMPNISPADVRKKYSIYDNKKSYGTESAQQLHLLDKRLNVIGYHIDYGRGDYDNNKK